MTQNNQSLETAEVSHPSIFIQEELDARGWTLDMLAMRMSPEFQINRLALDFYMEVGPLEPNLRIGDTCAKGLARAFDVKPEFFINLEKAWLEAQSK